MPGHDAAIYKMYEAEAAEIKPAGGKVHRVVFAFEFKKTIYGQLNKQGDYGNLNYARRQEDLAKLNELPLDLELAPENCRPAHMSRKLRAGFKIYGVNSISRSRRAQWKGRELRPEVLAL